MWGSRRLLATRRSPKAAGAWRRTRWSGVGYRQHHKWASIDLLARANTQRPSPLTSITPWEPELITLDNIYYDFLPANHEVLGHADKACPDAETRAGQPWPESRTITLGASSFSDSE